MKKRIKGILRPFYYVARLLIHLRILKTIYINFRLLPFKQAYHFPVLVLGKAKFLSLKGKIKLDDSKVRFGMVLLGKDVDEMPISSTPTKIYLNGILSIVGGLIVNKGANLSVEKGALLSVGSNVMICSGVLVKATERIIIGNYARIASGCFIIDSNMHSIKDVITGQIKKRNAPITIGNNVWLSMNTSVMPGTIVPDNSVTSRYAFLNKDYSKDYKNGAFFAGSPAKAVREGLQNIYNYEFEKEITNYFKNNPDAEFFQASIGYDEYEDVDKVHSDFRLF
ncbi:hypothetical protein [Labilibaculum sp.]|uniref:acyltransferase n=1 Tax=Labilibaculum sp. TaxID=2060723 RepID=UPI002AA5FC85|nr:hypothetical protein [Labilibaculum sp.]